MQKQSGLWTACMFSAAVIWPAAPAMADPYEDAQAIVEMTLGDDSFTAQFDIMRPILRPAIDAILSRFNVVLTASEADALFELYMAAFADVFAEQMRVGFTLVYLHEFENHELSELREFLETPTGQAFVNKRARLNRINDDLEKQVSESIKEDVGSRFKELLREGALDGKLSPENTRKVLGLPI